MTTEKESGVIFVASITLKNGKRIFASHYGLKGFPINVRKKRPDQPNLPGL